MLNMSKFNSKDSAQLLKILSNTIRLDILLYLRGGGKCVCNIFDHLRLPQNLISHHLALLRENGFIKARKDGKWVYYSLNPVRFSELEKFIKILTSIKNTETKSKC